MLKSKPSIEECGQCGSAQLNDTVSYCSDCAAYLCEFCTQAHKKMKLCRNHRVQTVASKGTELQHSDVSTPVTPQPLFCQKHLDEVLIVYCNECQCLVCRQCITDNHFGHKFNPINETTRKEVEVRMKSLLADSCEKLTQFTFYLEYVKGVESKKVSAPDKLKKEINDTCKKLITAIEKRREDLLLQVDTCSQNLKELWSQKEQLETIIVALQSSIAFAKRSLNCTTDAEMLALSQQAMSRLSELNLSKWDSTDTERIDATQTLFQQCEATGISQNSFGVVTCSGATGISPDSISQFGVVSTATTDIETIPNISMEIYSQDTSQKLEEGTLGKHTRVVLKFQAFPSFVGQAVSVTVRNSVQPNVACQNFPPLSISDIENLQHQVEVTFRPVVSGQHTISVTTGGKSGQVNVNVSGRPQVGDRVVQGPNWQPPPAPAYGQYGNRYGYNYGHRNYAYNNGIVTDNSGNQIGVQWDGQVTTQHNWNEHGSYFEIQLL